MNLPIAIVQLQKLSEIDFDIEENQSFIAQISAHNQYKGLVASDNSFHMDEKMIFKSKKSLIYQNLKACTHQESMSSSHQVSAKDGRNNNCISDHAPNA